MLRRAIFYAMVWGTLLLPLALLLLLRKRRLRSDEQTDGLESARAAGLVCAIVPLLQITLALLWQSSSGQLAIYVNIFLPCVGVPAGIAAACLYAAHARRPESLVGPVCCTIACLQAVVLFLGGMIAP